MASTFRLTGSVTLTSSEGVRSGELFPQGTLIETLGLKRKHLDDIELSADAPVDVSFGGLTNAHVVILKALGGKVRARLTSADGAAQSVPVDPLCILLAGKVPITAIDLTREAGVSTTISIFLGERV